MPTYDLINPSDPYTFEAPDDAIATTAVLVLNDAYGWACGGRSDGPFLFVDPGADDGKALLATAEGCLADRRGEVAAALASMTIEGERSSITDIGAQAHRLAERLTKPRPALGGEGEGEKP